MTRPKKLLIVAGARPNFVKIAPLLHALRDVASDDFSACLVHTGQHYDDAMSKVFFDELDIPRSDIDMGVGSGTHAVQTADIMAGFEPIVLDQRPDAVVVVGDVNSTLACSIVAVKLGVPVAHIESGLRSFDRAMPEEVNRVLTDSISELLFVSEPWGVENLQREGIAADKVHLVGNVMIDTLVKQRELARMSSVQSRLGLESKGYAVLTLHRPSNVDHGSSFRAVLDALQTVSAKFPIVFPVHPRTAQRLESSGLDERVQGLSGLKLVPPLGYRDFLSLQSSAAMVLTDSGGVQEETTFLGVPCITLRENTERPLTISHGTNVLVGTDTDLIVENVTRVLAGEWSIPDSPPPLWDGQAAERIVAILRDNLT